MKAKASRMNISVPAQMLARMRKQKGMNWSRIAVAAFTQELAGGNILPIVLAENEKLCKRLSKIADLATSPKECPNA